MDKLLGTDDAATELGVSVRYVQALIKDERLAATRRDTERGPVYDIRPADLAAYKATRRGRGRPKRGE